MRRAAFLWGEAHRFLRPQNGFGLNNGRLYAIIETYGTKARAPRGHFVWRGKNAMEKPSNFITEIIDEDLARGVVKEIHTRFPPEPNGYLHIGSVKAIWINWGIAQAYGGKFNLRYDDTNPAREDVEYVNSIREDLEWLGAHPNGGIFYGSDYFDKCYEAADNLFVDG